MRAADVDTNTLPLDEHGLALADALTLRPEAGGALPDGVVQNFVYYAVPVTDALFSIAETAVGAAAGSVVPFGSAGSRILVVVPLSSAKLNARRWASRLLDEMIPAHVVPLAEPYPEIVKLTVAELAVWKLSARQGAHAQSLSKMSDEARKRLERWGRGVPVRGAGDAQTPSNLAASASVPRCDRLGWNRFGGL